MTAAAAASCIYFTFSHFHSLFLIPGRNWESGHVSRIHTLKAYFLKIPSIFYLCLFHILSVSVRLGMVVHGGGKEDEGAQIQAWCILRLSSFLKT